MTKYAPKRIHFSPEGMIGRTQLAALDHNFNVGREQSKTAAGEDRFKVQYSKRKGEYVAKKIYDAKRYTYVEDMMRDVVCVANGSVEVSALSKQPRKPISRQDPPEKAEVVARLQSRMDKS